MFEKQTIFEFFVMFYWFNLFFKISRLLLGQFNGMLRIIYSKPPYKPPLIVFQARARIIGRLKVNLQKTAFPGT